MDKTTLTICLPRIMKLVRSDILSAPHRKSNRERSTNG
jgi:hypothetical protein